MAARRRGMLVLCQSLGQGGQGCVSAKQAFCLHAIPV